MSSLQRVSGPDFHTSVAPDRDPAPLSPDSGAASSLPPMYWGQTPTRGWHGGESAIEPPLLLCLQCSQRLVKQHRKPKMRLGEDRGRQTDEGREDSLRKSGKGTGKGKEVEITMEKERQEHLRGSVS